MFKASFHGLRPYQDEAISVILQKQNEGILRQLAHLPTGTGKTIIMANLIKEIQGKILILTHRNILVEQTKEKILLVDPNADIGIVQGTINETDNKIIIASVPTIGKQPSEPWEADRLLNIPTNFDWVIIDEAHHSTAKTWRRVLQRLGLIKEKYYPSKDLKDPTRYIETVMSGACLTGFTATPYRTDRQPLQMVFDEIVYHKDIFDFIPEYLSDFKFANIEQELIINGRKAKSSDISQSELNNVLKTREAKQLILDTYKDYCLERKHALGFCINISEAEQFCELFREEGINSSVVHSRLDSDTLEERLNRFKTGDIKVLWNVNILTEGFDFPPVDLLLICKALPTRNKNSKLDIENDGDLIFTQMIGRGTRIAEGKKDCLILDFGALLSNEARYEMLSRTADLLGIPHEEVNLTETIEEHKVKEEKRQKKKRTIEYGKRRLTQLMDTQRADRYSMKKYPWISSYHAYHLLTLNPVQEFRVFITDDSNLQYDIIFKEQHQSRIVAQGLTLQEAVIKVEDYIDENNLSIRLIDPQEQWLKLPATNAQKFALRKREIEFDDNIKRGEASHLITRYDIEITPIAQQLKDEKDIFKEYHKLLPYFGPDELLHLVSILEQGLSFETKLDNYHSISTYLKYRAIYRCIQELREHDLQDISEYFVNKEMRTLSLEKGLNQINNDLNNNK